MLHIPVKIVIFHKILFLTKHEDRLSRAKVVLTRAVLGDAYLFGTVEPPNTNQHTHPPIIYPIRGSVHPSCRCVKCGPVTG